MDIDEEILKSFHELRDMDITHDDLGSANGFHESQAKMTQACEYVQRLIDLINAFGQNLESGYLNDNLTKVKQHITQLKVRSDAINKLVQGRTNQQNYPQQRTSNQTKIDTTVAALQTQLYSFESALRLSRLESQLTSEDALTQIQHSASGALEAIEAKKSDAEAVLQTLRDKLSQYATEEAANNFFVLAGNHKTRETNWFWGFIAASVVTIGCIIWAVATFETSTELGLVVGAFLKRILVISTPAVFMRVCISKYNLERNLRIIYNHRDTVLEQYRVFEGSISDDDVDAKNQFRLELAKVIFDDPETGCTKSSASSEININPVLSTFEKVARSAS